MPERIGIMLVNAGVPDSPKTKDVRRYLRRYLSNPRIRPMGKARWALVLNLGILPKGSRSNSAKYARIWTDRGSPYMLAHEALERGLNAYYAQTGRDVVARIGMTYGDPSISSALLSLKAEGATKIIVLPLYPQSGFSTTEVVRDGVSRAFRETGWSVPYKFIDGYGEHPTYLKAIAASIIRQGFDPESDDRLLFSYRSIPLSDIEAGDDYELQVDASSLAIAGELGIERRRWSIGYQCYLDIDRTWLKPYSADILVRWAERCEGRTFLVCPNFAVDCLETLYDIPCEMLPAFAAGRRNAGLAYRKGDFVYVPCLGKSKAHLRVLIDVLDGYLPQGRLLTGGNDERR